MEKFRLLLMRAGAESLVDLAVRRLPGLGVLSDWEVASSDDEAVPFIARADAAFGILHPELFRSARKLRWLACPWAGPDPSYYHPDLVASEVVVTNMRGVYSDHIAAHILAFVLGFSRGLPEYHARQGRREWRRGVRTTYLPEATAVIIGVGGIGAETARRCADFGMKVIGVDPRVDGPPAGVERLVGPEALPGVLPLADFVIVTAPETPATRGCFDAAVFAAMRPTAFFINIGRGATVVLDDLDRALRGGAIAGAALDVFETEPLPKDHPLWDAPGMVITPHVATAGPYIDERRVDLFLNNCARFARSEPLLNVVDKAQWF